MTLFSTKEKKGKYMKPKKKVLSALFGGRVDRPPVVNLTSVFSMEVMEEVGVTFPDAHLESGKMAQLASSSYTLLGYDSISPHISIVHEAAALGFKIDWGGPDRLPAVQGPRLSKAEDIQVPQDFLKRDSIKVVLDAIKIVKKNFGNEVAIVGKILGPWHLAMVMFDMEDFVTSMVTNPDKVKKITEIYKDVCVSFANAQVEAGADVILVGNVGNREFCSPEMYRDFVGDLFDELPIKINAPTILHICGDTSDRLDFIADSNFDCFHFDTKVETSLAREETKGKMSLAGGISNVTLMEGRLEDVEREVTTAMEVGVDLISPECSIPLQTPLRALKGIAEEVRKQSREGRKELDEAGDSG
ncbi:MAG: MtaA/CmuA family methyltransferase [Methanomassiliicoccales archaeon]|nr:MAG: MtaA/CmuA family methyltransferase [Methanomassiliicoccales archaeon]